MNFNIQILKSVRANANWGHFILVIATLLSGLATARMMRLGSLDDHWLIRAGKIGLGLGLIEGGLLYAYHGIRKVYTNSFQRGIAYLFMAFLVAAMLCNLYTERMLARGLTINAFQQEWVDWAFDTIIVVVMLCVGAIQLLSDDARLERQALKAIGEDAEERLRDARGFPTELPEAEGRDGLPSARDLVRRAEGKDHRR